MAIHPNFDYIYHVTLSVTICKEILVENSYIKCQTSARSHSWMEKLVCLYI